MDATAANTGAQASQAIQLLDWLAALNCGQLSSLEGDSATIQAKGILDVCERLLLINSELKQSQAETIERLLPHRLELAKQYQQRSYTTASERLAAQVVEVRRWARRIAEHLMGQISIDLKSHCEACTWNASLSQEIKQQLLDERSCCQAKAITPLVKTNSEAVASSGGVGEIQESLPLRRSSPAPELSGCQMKIEGVTLQGPGIYSPSELQQTLFDLAKKLWPTIRSENEAKYRIHDWLMRKKCLDHAAINSLSAFTVLYWLEEEAKGVHSPPTKKTSGGGARRRRRKPGEQKLTSQGLQLVAALCQWHEISANGKNVLFNKQKPAIGCREVEREFDIPFATASEKFKELFVSHKAYSQKWEKNPVGLAYQLATLNGEVFCFGSDIPESEDDTED